MLFDCFLLLLIDGETNVSETSQKKLVCIINGLKQSFLCPLALHPLYLRDGTI